MMREGPLIQKQIFFLFYVFPAILAVVSYWVLCLSNRDFYSVSITFFGIFVALLLNMQVAVFGIYQRKWEKPSDSRLAEIGEELSKLRVNLLGEINSNISYAVFWSCVSLFVFVTLYGVNYTSNICTPIAVFIYTHFLLTLLMIIKRSHALFRKEYTSEL